MYRANYPLLLYHLAFSLQAVIKRMKSLPFCDCGGYFFKKVDIIKESLLFSKE